MNMDYSKAFELLNQDAEKERNKKAEKVVRDNLYNKGFRDGLAVIDKIRAEIQALPIAFTSSMEMKKDCLKIIDKFRAESEE